VTSAALVIGAVALRSPRPSRPTTSNATAPWRTSALTLDRRLDTVTLDARDIADGARRAQRPRPWSSGSSLGLLASGATLTVTRLRHHTRAA
jgi:hypothetical protein